MTLEDLDEVDQRKAKQEERAKQARDRELADLCKVLSIPEGRRLIWRFMGAAGVFRSSFTGDERTNFNEGRREIGLLILGDVMAAKPDAFTQMQREHAAEQGKKKEGSPV